jgi:hypothetical protein
MSSRACCPLSVAGNVVKQRDVKTKILLALATMVLACRAGAQSSTFTYQGVLSSNGVPLTGLFDLRFTLHNAATGGGQVGPANPVPSLGVTNGLFSYPVSFGVNSFDGGDRWVEIAVRPGGSSDPYAILSPRQAITATPYAVRAATFSGPVAATNLTGKIYDTNLSANVALLTNNVVFTGSVTASQFNGGGSALTNLNATNLTAGILPDARLSPNVALQNEGNVSFSGAVTATNYYGSGTGLTNVPGRIFEFIPTAGNVQAVANNGYLATNDTTAVVITLPLTANIRVGETVRVSGSGAAGWIVAQNAGQSILVANLQQTTGGSWLSVSNTTFNWVAAAVSGDGRQMLALRDSGSIYSSTNFWVTWTTASLPISGTAAAISGNGVYRFVAGSSSPIYYSISGAAWATALSGNANWSGLASSVSGQFVYACVTGGLLLRSSNFGVNWTSVPGNNANWTDIATSDDGAIVAACLSGGNIYVSTNGTSNWTARAISAAWNCVAMSADGSVMLAGLGNGQLYVSYDTGVSWNPTGPSAFWNSVSCSADGTWMLAAAGGSGTVYFSQDSGATWQPRATLPAGDYRSAAYSSDGSTIIAVATAKNIQVSSQASTTPGVAGQLTGARLAAVELQHVGNGIFIPLSFTGAVSAK